MPKLVTTATGPIAAQPRIDVPINAVNVAHIIYITFHK